MSNMEILLEIIKNKNCRVGGIKYTLDEDRSCVVPGGLELYIVDKKRPDYRYIINLEEVR